MLYFGHFERAGVEIALTAYSSAVYILLQTDFTTETAYHIQLSEISQSSEGYHIKSTDDHFGMVDSLSSTLHALSPLTPTTTT